LRLRRCGQKPENARRTNRYRPITSKHLASRHLLADLGDLGQGFAKFHLGLSSDLGTVALYCKVMNCDAVVNWGPSEPVRGRRKGCQKSFPTIPGPPASKSASLQMGCPDQTTGIIWKDFGMTVAPNCLKEEAPKALQAGPRLVQNQFAGLRYLPNQHRDTRSDRSGFRPTRQSGSAATRNC